MKNFVSAFRSDIGLLWFLFLLEGVAFGVAVNCNIADIYPRFNDQIQYLSEAYLGYEFYRQNGLLPGLWHTLSNPAAQGALHDFFALIILSLTGANRTTVLLVNFFVFMLWQAITFSAIKQSRFSNTVAWFGVALLLCLKGPWLASKPGSIFDFRLDHMAMCLMGVTIMAAAKSEGFLSRKWSILFGVFVGLTVLTRFLTAVYFAIVLILLISVYIFRDDYRARLKNIFLAAFIVIVLVVPFFLYNFDYLYNYYVVGHLTGAESAIRDPGMSVSEKFLFAVSGAFKYQGYLFWGVTVSIPLVSYLFLRIAGDVIADKSPISATWRSMTNWGATGIIFFVSPLLVLSLHKQISAIVLSILTPGVMLFALSFLAPILAAWERKLDTIQRSGCVATVLLVAVLGCGNFALRILNPPYSSAFIEESEQLNLVADLIHDKVISAGLKEPKIASDQVTDFMDAQIFRVMIYERKKVWLPLVMTLPTGIFEEDSQFLLNRLYQSDFVFLTNSMPNAGGWPYDKQMRNLYPVLLDYSESHLALVGKFHFYGSEISLYSKPSLVAP